jgi:hypothetical protein
MFRRFKGLVAGVFAGLLFAWMLVGGYVLGISNGFNHIGSSCRLAKNTIRNLQDLLAVVGLAVSALMVLGFLIAGWKRNALLDVHKPGVQFIVPFLWFIVANLAVFITIAIWIGCGALHLFF